MLKVGVWSFGGSELRADLGVRRGTVVLAERAMSGAGCCVYFTEDFCSCCRVYGTFAVTLLIRRSHHHHDTCSHSRSLDVAYSTQPVYIHVDTDLRFDLQLGGAWLSEWGKLEMRVDSVKGASKRCWA